MGFRFRLVTAIHYTTIMLFSCEDSSQLFRVNFIYCKSIEVDNNFSGHQVQSELRCCQTLADLNHTYLFEDPPLFAAQDMALFTDLSLNEQIWLMQQTGVLHHKLHCQYHLPPNYLSPGQCSHQAAALRDSRKKKLKWRIKTKKMRPLGRKGKLRVKRT